MSLPVWRELKRGERENNSENNGESLNEPSRLKGIETLRDQVTKLYIIVSEWAFPFEGNGNFFGLTNSFDYET